MTFICIHMVYKLIIKIRHVIMAIIAVRLRSAPVSKNTVYHICISDFMQTTFFYLERFLKKLAVKVLFINKGSIYSMILYTCIPFSMEVD